MTFPKGLEVVVDCCVGLASRPCFVFDQRLSDLFRLLSFLFEVRVEGICVCGSSCSCLLSVGGSRSWSVQGGRVTGPAYIVLQLG
jgi:hypothetical protein